MTRAAKRLSGACLLGLALLGFAPAAAFAATANAAYDRVFDEVMAHYRLPGLALGVIEDGKVVYTRTAGERVAGSGQPISSKTLFKIASNSKAMTAAVLARQVASGKLRWDDPVVRHLPSFRMHDPWVTRHMQVGELLVHNSGLPEGGGDLMLWPEPNHYTRADILAGLAHLKPAYSFRAGYAYDNLLYVVAGELAAAVGGASYEELVRREVFEPLGLGCRVGAWRRDRNDDVAQPHRRERGRNVVTDADSENIPAITSAAAGGIRCSLDDMLAWATNWLAPDARAVAWLPPEQRAALWTPRTPMPVSARRRAWDNTHFLAYAYGWRLADVDGAWTVSHTGTLSGMYSVLTLLPDRRSGFVMLTNGEAGDARTVVNAVLLKQFTKPGQGRTVAELAAELAAESKETTRRTLPDTSSRKTAGARQLQGRLGVWRDSWFGEVSICAVGGHVEFAAHKSPLLRGTLMHVGMRVLVDWHDDSVDAEAWLDFGTGDAPASLRMAKVDPEADFSYDFEDLDFTRERDCGARSTTSAAKSTGEAGLVDVATRIPDIALDMRYAGPDNFVGTRIDGYSAARCLLLEPAARALQRAQEALRADGFRLRVFDCYRPARAVRHFVRWAGDSADQAGKSRYFPNIEKSALLGDYIAPVSGHSRGDTVDLTLERCGEDGRCEELDMGTPFDFFDVRAHTDTPDITPPQRANRQRLRHALEQAGFRNYALEWWHYSLPPTTPARATHDVPIE